MANALIDGATDIFSGEKNLSTSERALSIVGGLTLAAIGAQPRPNMLLSLAAILAGSALAIRGATGHCPVGPLMTDKRDAIEHRS